MLKKCKSLNHKSESVLLYNNEMVVCDLSDGGHSSATAGILYAQTGCANQPVVTTASGYEVSKSAIASRAGYEANQPVVTTATGYEVSKSAIASRAGYELSLIHI